MRKGNWSETFTGEKFWPIDPNPAEVWIEDIARALSMMCRYGGHCKEFYSVGWHSILVADYLRDTGESPRVQLLGLLHDASEAYAADVPRPLKPFLDNYYKLEAKIQETIWEAFNLGKPTADEWEAVHNADNIILQLEGQILTNNLDNWAGTMQIHPMPQIITDLTYKQVRNKFIERFHELLAQQ